MRWLSTFLESLSNLLNTHAFRHLPGGGDSISAATNVNAGLMSAADKAKLDDIGSVLTLKGTIHVAADFPTLAAVQLGWTYIVDDPVTDNDPAKTNTGQSFIDGDVITWNGTGWTTTNNLVRKYVVTVVHGDYTTNGDDEYIAVDTLPATIKLATSSLAVIGKEIVVKNVSGADGLVVVGEGGENIYTPSGIDTSLTLDDGEAAVFINRDGTIWDVV